jgi:hypothetical protein
MSRVVNLRHAELGDAVYVGRASPGRGLAGSAFANPYRIGQDGDRGGVIEKYRQWLVGQPVLLDRLSELRGRRLACWCSPEPCHADVLIELVDADAVLDELEASGVAVEARDGKLRLSPASRVDAALRGRVAALKPAILSLVVLKAEPTDLWRQAVEVVAESLKLPADVLAAADRAECEPLQHEPEPAGLDGRGWTRYVCRKCGRFYGYAPGTPAALRPALERTYSSSRKG